MNVQLDNALRFHQTALNLRAQRQEVLAANIANADTPNYKARDIDFRSSLNQVMAGRTGPLQLANTSERHISGRGAEDGSSAPLYRGELQSSVDGNTVNMDTERAAFAENALQYEASLTFINGLLRTMQQAISGQ
ncbi:MAG: flagellar basal body rod protein FlgB [Candidatus Dactylopiibacterium carminicum]|uniref:Flagellar basal body rod protein FlgB n=1 Tax=Candidatus Dactylopiibacterium carminicum TaxID=857335 RepID=A0A272EU32_9RHOO|nr:flagellar basal body rod protein FlgB [Candidatus Dactylopiibacterium carminicum]KAF7599677.1 flagellar basal body rod protein FlgB [Candidatus Dactylopiibacterium carminicum]PAS93597.1 MAG: flagellar basal body rod protein FlgB [Candidatus Dactylopiibacterium carminicum]PAS97462.1 MAG: flagellar basal body rod protein FlgB [Candidatus Dactylopiibacterium carminicum]PAS99677.1 MAG: flagellar basal-body rod protein FlgB [Candidatus Dactylopiibacterium carminicum]